MNAVDKQEFQEVEKEIGVADDGMEEDSIEERVEDGELLAKKAQEYMIFLQQLKKELLGKLVIF